MEAGIAVVPVAKTQIVARPKRRPFQSHPTLWSVPCNDKRRTVYCGPTARDHLVDIDTNGSGHRSFSGIETIAGRSQAPALESYASCARAHQKASLAYHRSPCRRTTDRERRPNDR
jgi:hypothetical protein